MLFLIRQLLFAVGSTAVLVATGLPIGRRLGCTGLAERWGWGLACGLLVWAEGCFLAGLAHGLTRPVVAAGAGLALALGGRATWRLAVETLGELRGGWRRTVLAVAGLVFAVPLAASALYPPFDWDETIYHLVFARAFAASGALPFLIEARVPVFPPFAEALSAAALLTAGDLATHWLVVLATAASALLLLGWAATPRAVRVLACALYAGSPLVVYLAGLGYVDPLLTAFATAALAALERARRERFERWLVVAGLAAGGAAGVKYLGLFVAGWITAEATLTWSRPWAARLRAGARVALAATVVAAPVYLRILLWTGSPLFPFYPALFGSTAWSYEAVAVPEASPLAKGVESLAVIWRGVFDRGRVGEVPPFSPLWPFVVIGLAIGALRDTRARWAVAMLAAYLLVIPPNARYVLPLVPYVGLMGIAVVLRPPRRELASGAWLAAAALALALPGFLYLAYTLVQRGPVPLDAPSRRAFLERRLACATTVEFLNARGPGYRAYGLPLERLAGLADGRWFGDVSGPWSFDRVGAEIVRSGARAAPLRDARIEYLVVEEPWLSRVAEALRRDGARVVFRDGACAVFELPPSLETSAGGIRALPPGGGPALRTARPRRSSRTRGHGGGRRRPGVPGGGRPRAAPAGFRRAASDRAARRRPRRRRARAPRPRCRRPGSTRPAGPRPWLRAGRYRNPRAPTVGPRPAPPRASATRAPRSARGRRSERGR